MILDDAALLNVIVKNPAKEMLKIAKDYTDKLLMHIKGVNMAQAIERIMQFEPKDVIATRKKYAVSNKALFARVLRPRDKIFSAKGGSVYYNASAGQDETLKDYMSNIVYGYNIKKWLQTFWMPACDYDPMGLIFIEVDQQGRSYPTYKSVKDIFDYKLNGRHLEYVIFNKDPRIDAAILAGKGTAASLYRVVDDVSDRIVSLKDGSIVDVPDQTFLNYFLKVPAIIISDIYDPAKGMFISPEDDIIELADQFLTQGSVKNIFKNYFGFPRAWEYQSACPDCLGTTQLAGRDCPHCKATGLKQRTDPSETVYLPVPQSRDQHVLAPNVMGYISPDIAGWTKMDDELELLEDLMYQTMWGSQMMDDKDNQTATGKFIDVQPVNERLNQFSKSAEAMETFITDLIGSIMFNQSYKGASICYGTRYMIETPDEIWNKYSDARAKGAPTSALDDLYCDYLNSRYSANNMELQKQLKLMKVEPYQHFTLIDMAGISAFAQDELLKKLYYSQWIASMKESDVIFKNVETLQADFQKYCDEQDALREAEEASDAAPELDVNGNPVKTTEAQKPVPATKPIPNQA